MFSRHAVRATIGTLVLAPLAIGPLAVLAQASAPAPAQRDTLDTLLKVWSALSVIVIAGLHLWVRSIVRDHTDAASRAAADALKAHDENPSAHANHKNPAKYAVEIAEERTALNTLSTQVAVILARIESGHERNAEHWNALTERLSTLPEIESRLTSLEASCAFHKTGGGRA